MTQAVPNGVRILRRNTLLPELSVALLFEIAMTAVPVALVAPVVDPKTDTRYVGFDIPTPKAPAKVDVAVEVETTFPVMNLPNAVEEAKVATLVATILKKLCNPEYVFDVYVLGIVVEASV